MDTLSVSTKANLSLKVPIELKSAFQEIAKANNRSVHYVLIEALEYYLAERKAEEEYNEYVKNRVMSSYNDMIENGSTGLTSDEVKKIIMDSVEERLSIKK